MSNIEESKSVTIMMGWGELGGFGQDCLETLGNGLKFRGGDGCRITKSETV